MEGAARVLAGEFARSTLTIADKGQDAPEWVVTPGGAWCRRMYLAGALTEVSSRGDLCCCRVADPTGVFDLTLGGRNGGLVQAIEEISIPSFVAVTGTARLFQKNGVVSLTVRPEEVRVIDRAERDRILITTAEYTLRRLDAFANVLAGTIQDERTNVVIDHYAITAPDLLDLAAMVGEAVESIRPAPPAGMANDLQQVCAQARDIIAQASGPRGIAIDDVIAILNRDGIPQETVLAALDTLVREDECYQPQKGYLRLL